MKKKAYRLKELFASIFGVKQDFSFLFISHSHHQADIAHALARVFSEHDIRCWIAPDSIPAGSNYLNEIASALANSYAILLVLTPDAEKSSWVLKELESAVSSKIPIIPCIISDYAIGDTFRFGGLSAIQIGYSATKRFGKADRGNQSKKVVDVRYGLYDSFVPSE